ncbi:MAG TPA: (p)ppGpp synthetase [Clostridiales bacterium]|nr:(p)ppGpp synthetase [Clostridiales bacterium]
MTDFLERVDKRFKIEDATVIKDFYNKIKDLCTTERQKHLLEIGEENTTIIFPLELDFDMIFAGLALPLIREKEIDLTIFENHQSALELAQSVLTIESIDAKSQGAELESVRSMLVAMAKDIRVIILKLADILNRSRHAKNEFSNSEQAVLHKQVVDLYIPLASRLGLSYIKSELADLDLSYTNPNEYKKLMKTLAEDQNERKHIIAKAIEESKAILAELNIKGEVYGRLKHISSIYNKIHQKHYDLDEIYDFSAVRILVETVNECYSVLGEIHTKYFPINGRFKDYIARPKSNGYQSLHTTVLIDNMPLEFQIRTFEMHNHAEYGIAAHFLYKERKSKINELDSKLLWIRKLIENPNLTTSQQLVDELKTDVYSGYIFVQTPMGKIIQLPENSTPIDFAYAIHSNIGNKCVGAKVNGKMVTLTTRLKNADVVEIITSQNAKGPSRDWINIVQTSSAKNKINQFFKKEMRDENIKKGKAMLENSARAKELNLDELLDERWLPEVFNRYSLKSMDDMYSMIGCNGITTTQILNKLVSCYNESSKAEKGYVFRPNAEENLVGDSQKSSISELGSMMIKFAKCCNPVPGDDIVGFISRGRGVTIHKSDCKCLWALDSKRLMPLSWNKDGNKETSYIASIKLLVKNTSGVLANIANKIAEQKINISTIQSKNIKDGKSIIVVKVSISNTDKLNDLMQKLKTVEDVYEVSRGEND